MKGPERLSEPPGSGIEAQVIEYLRAHPDFLEKHAWILEGLEVPHACGDASSLVARQVSHLRHRNSHLRTQLSALIGNARDNERLSRRLHELTVSIIGCPTRDDVMSALREKLVNGFSIDFFDARFPRSAESLSPDPLPHSGPECGPISASSWTSLFGSHPFGLRTAVLIPFPLHEERGLLGLGSKDRERFTTEMGTLFWEQLGQTLGAVIRRLDRL